MNQSSVLKNISIDEIKHSLLTICTRFVLLTCKQMRLFGVARPLDPCVMASTFLRFQWKRDNEG